MEDVRIQIGQDSDGYESDDDGEKLMDNTDRQSINKALQEANTPSTGSDSDICMNPRRYLTEQLQQYDTTS